MRSFKEHHIRPAQRSTSGVAESHATSIHLIPSHVQMYSGWRAPCAGETNQPIISSSPRSTSSISASIVADRLAVNGTDSCSGNQFLPVHCQQLAFTAKNVEYVEEPHATNPFTIGSRAIPSSWGPSVTS